MDYNELRRSGPRECCNVAKLCKNNKELVCLAFLKQMATFLADCHMA